MICNICSEEIEKNQEVKLVCDPKHIFCIECITEWYKQVRRLKHTKNYYTPRMCPICRRYGGYLPLMDGNIYIKGIHKNPNPNENKKEDQICNKKLKTKDGFCTAVGKVEFGGRCGRHKNQESAHQENPNIV
jgi:hypothetical protein